MIRITRIRGILSDKLLNWFVEQRINSATALRLFIFVYGLLSRGYYVHEHNVANHHFIPRFLLEKFKIINTGQIFEYRRNLKPERRSIKKEAALAPNLYSFRDKRTKMPSDFIEKQIYAHVVEKYGSRIISRIIETDKIELTHLEESILAIFIAFQYTRTPRFFFQLGLVLTYLAKEKNITPEEMARPYFARNAFINNSYQLQPSEIAEFLKKTRLGIDGVENLLLRLSIQIANDISGKVFSVGQMTLLRVARSGFFFLSDSPVEIFNFGKNRSIGPFFWELNDDVLIYLPISPTRCVYYDRRTRSAHLAMNSSLIWELSLRSIHELAYSDRESSLISDFLKVSYLSHL